MGAGHGSTDLGDGWSLTLSSGQAQLKKSAKAPVSLEPKKLEPGGAVDWAGWSIQLKPGRAQARSLKEGKAFWFSQDLAHKGLCVRAAKDGERLKAFGLQGSKLVRDLLAEAKVPVWQRQAWPVLEADGRLRGRPGPAAGPGLSARARP